MVLWNSHTNTVKVKLPVLGKLKPKIENCGGNALWRLRLDLVCNAIPAAACPYTRHESIGVNRGMAALILTVGTRSRWLLSRTPRPLYVRGKSRVRPQSRPVNQVVQSRNTRQHLLSWSGNSCFVETEFSPMLLRSLKCRRWSLVLKGISKLRIVAWA